MSWNEIKDNDFWKYEQDGDKIEGVLIDTKEKKGEVSAIYVLETEVGVSTSVWGSTILDKRMEKVVVGQLIRITYKGRQPVKDSMKKDVKIFKVEVWENDAQA